jgi:hypothetical protein
VHQDQLNNDEDPFEDFGFGVITYFNLLRYLILSYVLISAIAAYMMYKYTFGDALENSDGKEIN